MYSISLAFMINLENELTRGASFEGNYFLRICFLKFPKVIFKIHLDIIQLKCALNRHLVCIKKVLMLLTKFVPNSSYYSFIWENILPEPRTYLRNLVFKSRAHLRKYRFQNISEKIYFQNPEHIRENILQRQRTEHLWENILPESRTHLGKLVPKSRENLRKYASRIQSVSEKMYFQNLLYTVSKILEKSVMWIQFTFSV